MSATTVLQLLLILECHEVKNDEMLLEHLEPGTFSGAEVEVIRQDNRSGNPIISKYVDLWHAQCVP
jgi:hypothetical protein